MPRTNDLESELKDQRIKDLEAALDSIKKWVDWTNQRPDVEQHGLHMIKTVANNALEGIFKVHSEVNSL